MLTPTIISTSEVTAWAAPALADAQFTDCQIPDGPANAASVTYCVVPSPNDPNTFSVSMNLDNETNEVLDLSHTLICSLQRGTSVKPIVSNENNFTLAPDGSQFAWKADPALQPKAKDTLRFLITKAANSTTLVTNIRVTGLRTTRNSPFAAVLPGFEAKLSQQALVLDLDKVDSQAVTVPATGVAPAPQSQNLGWVAVIVLLFIIVGGISAIAGLAGRSPKQKNEH
jgi:hypothetical protein